MNKEKQKLITYGMYCNYIKEIKHYDSIQTYFRILSSTILLGSFTAIGFIFSTKMSDLPFRRSFAVLIVLMISTVTLLICWNVDQLFYEKQLISNFAEAFRLERENRWIPKVHQNMLMGAHKKDRPTNIVYFYIGCISSLILTTGIMVFIDFFTIHNLPVFGYIAIGVALVFISFIFFILKKKTKKIETFIKELKM